MKKRKIIITLIAIQSLIATPIFASNYSIDVTYRDNFNKIVKTETIQRNMVGKVSVYSKPPMGYAVIGDRNQTVEISETNPYEKIEFYVEDKQSPKGKGVNQTVFLGDTLSPEDFVTDIQDNSNGKVSVEFRTTPDFYKEGRQNISILLTDENGNTSTVGCSLLIVDMDGFGTKSIKSEYGKNVNAGDFFTKKLTGVTYRFVNLPDFKKLGTQKVSLVADMNGKITSYVENLEIVDTTGPKGKLIIKEIDIHDKIKAIDLVTDVFDEAGGKVDVYFKEEPKWGEFGNHRFTIALQDERRNITELKGTLKIINKKGSTAITQDITIEAGTKVKPDRFIKELTNPKGVEFEFVKEPLWTKVGRQRVEIMMYDVRGYETKLNTNLNIIDTRAPNAKLKTKELIVPLNSKVTPEQFIEELTDNSDGAIKTSFHKEPDTKVLGEQKLRIMIEDSSKNQRSYSVNITVVDPKDMLGTNNVTVIISPDKGTYFVKETKKLLNIDSAPILENGRTLVPVSNLARVLGVSEDNIKWHAPSQKATITIKDVISNTEKNVEFKIGSNEVYLNGQYVKMETPAKIINGRTYVPLKYAMDGLGITKYDWDSNNREVIIKLENINDVMYKMYK